MPRQITKFAAALKTAEMLKQGHLLGTTFLHYKPCKIPKQIEKLALVQKKMMKEERMESLRMKRKVSVKVAKENAVKFVFEIHDNAEPLNLFEHSS